MPYANERGQLEHGVGGGQASIDNVAFSPGGAGGWITDDLAGFINGADGWTPASYDPLTEQRTRLHNVAVNNMFSGGGQWATFRASQDPERGLYSSSGLRLQDGQPLAVGPDGALCYKPQYHSLGPTLVREVDGAEWTLTASVPRTFSDLQLLGWRRAIWLDVVAGLSVVGIPKPLVVPGTIYRPRACQFGGKWWISYFHVEIGVLLHPFDKLEGWIITPVGVDAWQEIVPMATTIRVGWGTTEAEQPGQIRRIEIDPVLYLRVDLDTGQVTPDRPVPLRVPVTSTPINKTMYQGWFVGQSDAAALGRPDWQTDIDWRTLPGNCRLEIPNRLWKDRQDRLIAAYVEGSPDTDINAIDRAIAAQKAKDPYKLVLAYWPRQAWSRVPAGCEFVGVEAYQGVSEPDVNFEVRVRNALALVSPQRRVLIPQCYSSNLNNTANLEKVAAICSKIAADVPMVGMVAFNGTGRKTGFWQHPEVVPIWTTIAATVTAPATPPAQPKPPEPEPPKPKPPVSFPFAKELHMDPTKVAVRVGSTFLRVDPAEVGKHPTFPGFTPVHINATYDQALADSNCHFMAREVSPGRFELTQDGRGWLGQDATEFGAGIEKLFYVKPSDPQGYETWNGWTLGAGGPEIVTIQYDRSEDHGKTTGVSLTLVKV